MITNRRVSKRSIALSLTVSTDFETLMQYTVQLPSATLRATLVLDGCKSLENALLQICPRVESLESSGSEVEWSGGEAQTFESGKRRNDQVAPFGGIRFDNRRKLIEFQRKAVTSRVYKNCIIEKFRCKS